MLRLRAGVGRVEGAVRGQAGWGARGLAFIRKEDTKTTERKQRREVEASRMMDIFSKCLEPPPFEVPKLEPAELEKGGELARTYAARLWRRHNDQHKDLQVKLRARMVAVWALPTEELRQEALVVTEVVYPPHARRAELYPPEAGFQQDRSLVQDPRMLEDSRFARMVKAEASLGQDVGADLLARATARRTEGDEGDDEEEEEDGEAGAAANAAATGATTTDAAAAPVAPAATAAAKAAPAKDAKKKDAGGAAPAAAAAAGGAAAPAAPSGGKEGGKKKKDKMALGDNDIVI